MKSARKKADKPEKDVFCRIIEQRYNVEVVPEYRFHPVRKWRFDYAIPERHLAIEIDGGVWSYGRHNRASGYMKDMEKFNAAAELGWTVMKFTPQQKMQHATFEAIGKALSV